MDSKEFKKNSDFKIGEIPNGDYEGIMTGQEVLVESINTRFKVAKGIGGKSRCLIRSHEGVTKVYIGSKIYIPIGE